MAFDWQAPHDWSLYRVFDGSGVLLYVGISTQVDKRLKAHTRWMKNHAGAYVETEQIGTMAYDEAQVIESAAINADPLNPPPMNRRQCTARSEAIERERQEDWERHQRAEAAYFASDEYIATVQDALSRLYEEAS